MEDSKVVDKKATVVEQKAAVVGQKEIKKEKAKSFRVMCSEKTVGTLYDHRNEVRIPAHGTGDVKIMGEIPTTGWLAMQIESGLVMVVED